MGLKAQNLYDLMNKVTLIDLMTVLLHKNLDNCSTQESSYWFLLLKCPSSAPKASMSLNKTSKLISLRNFIQSTSKLQPMHQYLFIQELLLYKYLSDISELDVLK